MIELDVLILIIKVGLVISGSVAIFASLRLFLLLQQEKVRRQENRYDA